MEDHARPVRPVLSVAAVVVDGGRVVLVRRRKAPDAGEWSIPGGAMALGEPIEAALRREVFEETGLDVTVGDFLEVYERVERDEAGAVRFHFVVLDYRCAVVGGQMHAGDDAAEVALVEPTDLDRYEMADSVRRVIASAMRSTPADPAAR